MLISIRTVQIIALLALISLAGCDRTVNEMKDRVADQDVEVKTNDHPTPQENLPPDGPFVLKHDDGSIASVTHFKAGKKHGNYKGWYSDDVPQWDENYDNGLLHGSCTYWHESGQKKAEFEYRQGRRHGTWTEWDENGEVKAVQIYEDENLISEK